MDWTTAGPLASCEALTSVLKDRVWHEEFYAKGLVKASCREVLETGTLGMAVQEMRNYMQHRGEQAAILANDLLCDLIEPLQTYGGQRSEWRKAVEQGKMWREEVKIAREKHDRTYERYVEQWQEVARLRRTLEQGSKDVAARYSDLEQFQVKRKEGWTAEREYKQSLSQYDSLKQRYNAQLVPSIQPRLLASFQTCEHFRRLQLRDIMRKVAIYEMSWLRNVQYEARQLLEAMESIDVAKDVEELVAGTEVELPELAYREEEEAGREGQRSEDSEGVVERLRKLAGRWMRGGEEEQTSLQHHLSSALSSVPLSLDSQYSLHSLLKSSTSRHFYTSLLLSQCPNRLSDPALEQLTCQIHVLIHESMQAREGNIVLDVVALAGKVEAKEGTMISRMRGWKEWQEEWLWQVAASLYPQSYLHTTMELLGLQFIETSLRGHWRQYSMSVLPNTVKKPPRWTEELQVPAHPLLSFQSIPSLHTEYEDLEPELSTEPLALLPSPSKSGDLTLPPPSHLS